MSRLIHVSLFLCSVLFLLSLFNFSCSTAPEFERDNENDPYSRTFIPDINNLSIAIHPNKTVSLNWIDNSEYEEGFIISKSFGSDSNFVPIDTIPPSSTSYLDVTKKLDVNTYYKISANTVQPKQNPLPGLVIKLNYGFINTINTDVNGSQFNIDWANDNLFADYFLIEKKQPESENWERIGLVEGKVNNFFFEDLSQSYFIDIRISSFLEDYNNKSKLLNTFINDSISYNLPSEFKVEVVNEESINVVWNDNSKFQDKIIVYQRDAQDQLTPGTTDYSTIDTLSSNGETFLKYSSSSFYDITIAPYYEKKNGAKLIPKIITIFTEPPSITSVEFANINQVRINWVDENYLGQESKYSSEGFVLELSINEGEYNLLEKTNSLSRFITIPNLSTTNKYTFRIRSFSSKYSYAEFKFSEILKEEASYTLNSKSDNLDILGDGSMFYSVRGESYTDRSKILFFDSFNGEKKAETNKPETRHFFSVSPNGNLFAFLKNNGLTIYDISDFSFIEKPYEEKRSTREFNFITDSTIIMHSANKDRFELLNINTGKSSIVLDRQNTIVDKLEVSKTKDFFYWSEASKNFKYDLNSNTITEIRIPYLKIEDSNLKNEILVMTSDAFLVIDSHGAVPLKFERYYRGEDRLFLSGIFLNEDYILISSNLGYIYIFDKKTGEYLSRNKFSISETGSHVYGLSASNKSGKIMAMMRNGLYKIFSIEKSWNVLPIYKGN